MEDKAMKKENPVCRAESMVVCGNCRISVLTDCLFRIEYSESGIFEDHATQSVVNREFPKVDYTVREENGFLKIKTSRIEISYDKGKFSKGGLQARVCGGARCDDWYYGKECENFKGTARTLDRANGEIPLEDGIQCSCDFAVVDDSASLIIDEAGWIAPRENKEEDFYLFCYCSEYKDALNAFYTLTGKTPLIPRYALGNWWSRYYEYTQEGYEELLDCFEKENIPLSVAVIDMDWHVTKIDKKYGSGWTGYTWNEELFPDYRAFLKNLHERKLRVTLNLHPAEGVAAHEVQYEEMAKRMGIDPKTEETVPFDATSRKFMKNYFDVLIHPFEDEGVDFWWMDWQQGTSSLMEGLDPLWMLNYLHYKDSGRDNRRPMIFSRYAGIGSHRYPIGFSGDTHITWASLDFQPYFTNNAANVGYGWWSHDIGGHMCGAKDNELFARWVEYGVFSPIMRLHSSKSEFLNKEPWVFDAVIRGLMGKFMRLRHAMIPYLYSMNRRASEQNIPLITPLYYENPNEEAAYNFRNEYYFGTEMLVSPITKKSKRGCMGEVLTYFPNGTWFDFFTGYEYSGGKMLCVCREIDEYPVFVKAGGIIPLSCDGGNGTENPHKLAVEVFPSDNGRFEMYEDDGTTMDYENGGYAITSFDFSWGDKPVLRMSVSGNADGIIPGDRTYEIRFRKLSECTNVTVTDKNGAVDAEVSYDNESVIVSFGAFEGEAVIAFNENVNVAPNDYKKRCFEILCRAEIDNYSKGALFERIENGSVTAALAQIDSVVDDECVCRELFEAILAK